MLPDADRDRVGETEGGQLAQVGMKSGRQQDCLASAVARQRCTLVQDCNDVTCTHTPAASDQRHKMQRGTQSHQVEQHQPLFVFV